MTHKRHIEKSGKNYTIHSTTEKKKMPEKDYQKEFNKVAYALERILPSNMTDAEKLWAIANVNDSMHDRPHQAVVVEDKSQLKLGF